jgi:hypothetical protein
MAYVFQDVLGDARILPLWHVRRQQHRDDRLWIREEQHANLYQLKHLHCPCTKCKGHFLYNITNVKEHLIHNGRDPRYRVWRGPCNKDSLDEKWEEEFRVPTRQQTQELDFVIDM